MVLCQGDALGVRLFGSKPGCKDKFQNACSGVRRATRGTVLTNSLFSITGNAGIFPKSCSSPSPTDFFERLFSTAARGNGGQTGLQCTHTLRFPPTPVTCWLLNNMPLCETYSTHLKQVSRENTPRKCLRSHKARVVKTNSTHSLAYADTDERENPSF